MREGAIALGAFAGQTASSASGSSSPTSGRASPSSHTSTSATAYRGAGIGGRLSARSWSACRDEAGDTSMVVSATPSANTVRFYLGRGFEPMAEALPELYELEPEDVHMEKRL